MSLTLYVTLVKGLHVENCWEALYMQVFHQRNVLIEEQKVNDINPLFKLPEHIT
jgi:hypothetical protein